ncbi:MAG: DUF86 domain-containing protein [Planctomycetes bacterium]|nr:DUF86 domain-containing protein [Planctomycetota bacterium]
MKDEILAHLHDIVRAGEAIKGFIASCTFEDYTSDELLRSAVERKFEIMGEALNRIGRDDSGILRQIQDHRDIVSFRNILVHGYDTIDDQIVWGVIKEDLSNLLEDVQKLLD